MELFRYLSPKFNAYCRWYTHINGRWRIKCRRNINSTVMFDISWLKLHFFITKTKKEEYPFSQLIIRGRKTIFFASKTKRDIWRLQKRQDILSDTISRMQYVIDKNSNLARAYNSDRRFYIKTTDHLRINHHIENLSMNDDGPMYGGFKDYYTIERM